ncbi:DUF3387 domain-containing protein [candidate division TA06 bacterium]|uniref:DUF3387 domain-containing protein n=1 Tax=candidate division TA06 bacterium TaxID=2250710 RepID=A0A523UNB5_UNCT6|nr:MAG: DUF3387 domain-containing protein [candidate division TA06 bacterium]
MGNLGTEAENFIAAMAAKFEEGRKRIQAQRLRTAVTAKLSKLLLLNRTRADYQKMLERMIDEYNAGSINVEQFFKSLVEFAQDLSTEEQRAIAEELSEEELAIFDLLTKPDMKLTKKEKLSVKKVALDLLQVLKREKLVLDWRKRQQSRAAVRLAIEERLDQLPESYSRQIYEQKCEVIYEHIYESYYGEGESIYALAG